MASRYAPCVIGLMKLSEEEFVKVAGVLIKIAQKIESNPEVEKFKSLKIGSKTFMESILPFDGAVQCLYEMGFVEDDDRYVYSGGQNGNLITVKNQLEDLVSEKQKNNKKPAHNAPTSAVQDSLHLISSEAEIHQRLNSHFNHVLIYEDRTLQEKARSVVPLSDLEEKARLRLSRAPEFSNGKQMGYKDCLILDLLQWFKRDFFTWTDAPKCGVCGEKPSPIGMLQPGHDDKKWGASRVEGYKCNRCDRIIRFPRYNHPGKLLETRTGRCGEWANCFSLLCRSVGFDTRHVVDWTDHVWTEVYSHTAKRWLHCDPCENVCDKPLLYEQGWGKKLSLLVAFSCEEAVDVTWRYTDKPKEVIGRRKNMFREFWLRNKIVEISDSRKAHLDTQTRDRINSRLVREMVEFISPKIKAASKYGGRTTGSLQWRQARGELGEGVAEGCAGPEGHIIVPTAGEVKSGKIDICYYSASDKYVRKGGGDSLHWESLVHTSQNIDRKEENDWKMVYLARTPSSNRGYISWKIDVGPESKQFMEEVKVTVNSTVYQSGLVKWLVCTDKLSIPIESGGETSLKKVSGARTMSLHAFLSGGKGDQSWQHTQLFRETMDSEEQIPQLRMTVTLSSKTS